MIKFIIKTGCFSLVQLILSILLISSSSAAADKTIGVIMIPNIPYFEAIHKAFMKTLSSEGLTEDKVEVITLKPLPDPISLMNTTRKFAAIDTDIIVSYGAPSALASVSEQSDIPVVFAGVFDPDAVGISLKNATGIKSSVPITALIKKLKGISNFSKLGIVYSDTEKDTVMQADEIEKLGNTLSFSSVRFNVKKIEDAEKISAVDALILTTSCPATHCVINIMDIARKAKIPTATLMGNQGEDGVILTIAANPGEQGRMAAKMVSKILEGAKASSLSVEQPKKVDLVINLKEASMLGLKIPFEILSSATKIIK
jgi:putative ABC transport system substrate-binding protein